MEKSRIKNSKRNIIASYIDTVINLLFSFFSRTVIVYTLGDGYLGLSSLFTSILQVINMVELGFSVAIVFNMYKPLAEGDTNQVNCLLAYYKKVYIIVGIIVFICGLVILPFLPLFIKKGIPSDANIYVIFGLYLINTCLSYVLFAYKTALLNALQRLDLTKIAYTLVNILQYSLQMISLLFLKNYYVFLVLLIAGTVAKNLLSAFIAQKKYPEYYCDGEINQETKKDIKQRVKGLMICSISSTTYTTLDSIILSSFIGLSIVAIYNNYLSIYSIIASLVILIRNAMQASVGNSIAVESREKNYSDLLLWQFFFSVIATWCATCLFCLYQPFMIMWMGTERLLPISDVALFSVLLFINVTQHSFYLYISGNGMWLDLKIPYILSTIINLLMNIILGKVMGTTGVIISTVFVSFFFGFVWQSKIVLKNYFNKSINQYQIRNILYFLVFAISSTIAFLVNQLLCISGIVGFVVKLLICSLISIGTMFIAYNNTTVYKDAKRFCLRVLSKSNSSSLVP